MLLTMEPTPSSHEQSPVPYGAALIIGDPAQAGARIAAVFQQQEVPTDTVAIPDSEPGTLDPMELELIRAVGDEQRYGIVFMDAHTIRSHMELATALLTASVMSGYKIKFVTVCEEGRDVTDDLPLMFRVLVDLKVNPRMEQRLSAAAQALPK